MLSGKFDRSSRSFIAENPSLLGGFAPCFPIVVSDRRSCVGNLTRERPPICGDPSRAGRRNGIAAGWHRQAGPIRWTGRGGFGSPSTSRVPSSLPRQSVCDERSDLVSTRCARSPRERVVSLRPSLGWFFTIFSSPPPLSLDERIARSNTPLNNCYQADFLSVKIYEQIFRQSSQIATRY